MNQILAYGWIYQMLALRWQPLMGEVSVMWPIFLNFDLNHIFGVGETSHFKCRVPTDTEVY